MSAYIILAQAAVEYGTTTAQHYSTASQARTFQQAVDDARGFVSDHTFMVILGAVVGFALLRLVFTAPRVR